jgi:hypothetical protein
MRTDPVPIGGVHIVKPGAIQAGLNGPVGRLGTFLGRLVRRQLTHLVGGLVSANEPRRESWFFSFSDSVLARGTFKIVENLPDCAELGPWRARARELLRSADRRVRSEFASSHRSHSRRLDSRPRAPRRREPAGRQSRSGAASGGGDGSAGDGGGGGSDPGEPGGDGDPDPEAPAVESSQSLVCRGGRHGS